MDELFVQMRFGIKVMESLACIIGFSVWARLSPGFWRSFPFYLLLIVCCEFTGWYLLKNGYRIQGRSLYNYFVVPLEFLFMYYLFYKNLASSFKNIVVSVVGAYAVSFVVEKILLTNINWIWMSVSYSIGCAGLFILITIYFLQLVNSERVVEYKNDPFFWVCLGLTVFYVGTFPFYAMPTSLASKNERLYMLLSWMVVIFNYAMYGLFIKAFLCHRKVLK